MTTPKPELPEAITGALRDYLDAVRSATSSYDRGYGRLGERAESDALDELEAAILKYSAEQYERGVSDGKPTHDVRFR